MKTKINQSVTVLSFFTLAITATLTISWGMTKLIYPVSDSEKKSFNAIVLLKAEEKTKDSLISSFKLLIPKIK